MENLNDFLIPSLLIFFAGLSGMVLKKNLLVVLMCLELMLCGAMLVLVSFSAAYNDMDGAVFAFFVMAVAASEVAVALAVVVQFFKIRRSVCADDVDTLSGE